MTNIRLLKPRILPVRHSSEEDLVVRFTIIAWNYKNIKPGKSKRMWMHFSSRGSYRPTFCTVFIHKHVAQISTSAATWSEDLWNHGEENTTKFVKLNPLPQGECVTLSLQLQHLTDFTFSLLIHWLLNADSPCANSCYLCLCTLLLHPDSCASRTDISTLKHLAIMVTTLYIINISHP